MHYGDDNTTIHDLDHEQRMTDETRDLVWQAFTDWARRIGPWDVVECRLRFGSEHVNEFLRYHKESDLFYALAQIQREREREAA